MSEQCLSRGSRKQFGHRMHAGIERGLGWDRGDWGCVSTGGAHPSPTLKPQEVSNCSSGKHLCPSVFKLPGELFSAQCKVALCQVSTE